MPEFTGEDYLAKGAKGRTFVCPSCGKQKEAEPTGKMWCPDCDVMMLMSQWSKKIKRPISEGGGRGFKYPTIAGVTLHGQRKYPWQLSIEQFRNAYIEQASSEGKRPAPSYIYSKEYDAVVKTAHRKGMPVPKEVLSQFPELRKSKMPETRLPKGLRNKLNNALAEINSPPYYHYVGDAFGKIKKAFRGASVVILMEDNTEFAGFFAGKTGKAFLSIAPVGYADEEGIYSPYKDTGLVFNWYKMPSGNYEINSYIS